MKYPDLEVPNDMKVDQTQLKIFKEIEEKISRTNTNKRSPSPSGSVKKRLTKDSERNTTENDSKIEKQPREEVKKKSLIEQKLEAAAPYNYFLTKVKENTETHKAMDSIYMTELLHPSLGQLSSSLQINFMVDLEWLMMNYEATKTENIPLVLLYGAENPELSSRELSQVYPNLRAVRIKPKYPFGTHHSKMMVLVYRDGGVRVVVHTANLVPGDWENRTQGES